MQPENLITLCADQAINFKNISYVPNSTLGYFEFRFSRAFPAHNNYGSAIHPAVIAKHYQTALNQNLNLEHKLRVYDPQKKQPDTFVGSIVAVDFPHPPSGKWTVQADPKKAPEVTGIASLFKRAFALDKVLGDHMTGRHKYSVSLEVDHELPTDGFAVQMPEGSKVRLQTDDANLTPPDMLQAGWEYWPTDKAPKGLLATFSEKNNRIAGTYKNRKVLLMMGGLDGPIHYAGMGLVRYGAEPTAGILRTAAKDPTGIATPFRQLKEALDMLVANSKNKSKKDLTP